MQIVRDRDWIGCALSYWWGGTPRPQLPLFVFMHENSKLDVIITWSKNPENRESDLIGWSLDLQLIENCKLIKNINQTKSRIILVLKY